MLRSAQHGTFDGRRCDPFGLEVNRQRFHPPRQSIEFPRRALDVRDGCDGRGRKLLDFRKQARLLRLQVLHNLEEKPATRLRETIEASSSDSEAGAHLVPDLEELRALIRRRAMPHNRGPPRRRKAVARVERAVIRRLIVTQIQRYTTRGVATLRTRGWSLIDQTLYQECRPQQEIARAQRCFSNLLWPIGDTPMTAPCAPCPQLSERHRLNILFL